MRLKNRLRGVKGSCFLTHGSDDYDHDGLKNALRATSKDLIREALEDAADPVLAKKPNKYRLVIFTQVYENYGYRWKAKGGCEYHIRIVDITAHNNKTLTELVNLHRHLIEKQGDSNIVHSCDEYIINWEVFADTELTPEESFEADDHYLSSADWVRAAAARDREYRERGWMKDSALGS